jgi:arylsulfatase A-like enzyme
VNNRGVTSAWWSWAGAAALLGAALLCTAIGLERIQANEYLSRGHRVGALASFDLRWLASFVLLFPLLLAIDRLAARVSPRGWASVRQRSMPAIGALAIATTLALTATPLANRALIAREPARPNVILISMDALRASALGAYGRADARTPRLDRFAAQGAVFENAISPSTWTLPSHASMLTGLYPASHGVRQRGEALPPAVETLPEILRERGYATAAFTNAGWLSNGFGFGQGFDRLSLHIEPSDPSELDELLRWIGEQRRAGRRHFAFFHSALVHPPYAKREGFAAPSLDPIVYSRPPQLEDARYRAAAPQAYADAVAYMDYVMGGFLDALTAMGADADTLVILTADHGEEFGEHGRFFHGDGLHDEVLRVPLILRLPSAVPAGGRVRQQISMVDLAPTLLALLGVPAPATDGVDVAPLLHGGQVAPHPAFTEFVAGPRTTWSVRTDETKLIVAPARREIELFDLRADPLELRNLAGTDRPEEATLMELYDRFAARSTPALSASWSAAARASLRELGYLGP